MVVTPPSPASRPSPIPAATTATPPAALPAAGVPGQLAQLRFLYDVARLVTTAQTWDELLETVVDGTRDALHADVSSLYLVDRDGAYLTLAATNGLDHYQIGRARVPFGEGVTGRVAASREPLVIPDVRADARRPGSRAGRCRATSGRRGAAPRRAGRCTRGPRPAASGARG